MQHFEIRLIIVILTILTRVAKYDLGKILNKKLNLVQVDQKMSRDAVFLVPRTIFYLDQNYNNRLNRLDTHKTFLKYFHPYIHQRITINQAL